jgi:ribosomal protein S18 acetylase RimI-like enzyme
MLSQPSLQPFTLRQAIADDVAWAGPLLFSCGPALFSYIFASPSDQSQDILCQAFVQPGHAFSYECTQVVEIGGQPTGLMVGYSGTIKRQVDERVHFVMARIMPLMKLPRILVNVADLSRIKQDVSAQDYYLLSMGVLPEFRNQGLGSYLLGQAEIQAHQAGCRAMCLDVTFNNRTAQSLFQRQGYQITVSKTTDRFERMTRAGGLHRMVKRVER